MHKNTRQNTIIIITSFLLFWPLFSLAQIEITEIMFDPEGNDEGREWIEILNNSSSTVDLTGWKLFENQTNHKLSGDLILSAGEYAVIVDQEDMFRVDYPDYSGLLIDSFWDSLKNTGEYLAIKDADLNIIYEITYDDTWQPQGMGTPGAPDTAPTSEPPPVISSGGGGGGLPPKPKAIAKAGPDIITTNPSIQFDGSGSENANDFFWNFGDGTTSNEISPLHTYQFPGEYLVTLQVGQSTDNLLVIIYNNLIINEFYPPENWLELIAPRTFDLAGWKINDFEFPANSLIKEGQYLVVPVNINNPVQVIYPNGEIAQEISFEENGYAIALSNGNYVYTDIATPGGPNFIISKIKSQISKTQTKAQKSESDINLNLAISRSTAQLLTVNSQSPINYQVTAGIGLLVNKLVIPVALVLVLGMLMGYALRVPRAPK